MNNQLDLLTAINAGITGANQCRAKAQRSDPLFSQRAATAILNHLRAVRQASGEELVDIAIAHGAHAHDQRAFGGVFQALARRGLIVCLRSDLPRKRGHGTSGGRLYGWGGVA